MHYRRRHILRSSRRERIRGRLRRAAFIAAAVLAVSGISAAALAWGLGNPRVVITDIEISGNAAVSAEDITAAARSALGGKFLYFFRKDNLALYPKKEIAARILEEKRIKEVYVYGESLTKIAIDVKEREPKYIWCGAEKPADDAARGCSFMDDEGYIFAKAPQFSGPVFFAWYGALPEGSATPVGTQFLPVSEFKKLSLFQAALRAVGIETTSIGKKENGDYELTLKRGGRILFNSEQDSSALIDNLRAVFSSIGEEQAIDYVDARFGNKIFFKKLQDR